MTAHQIVNALLEQDEPADYRRTGVAVMSPQHGGKYEVAYVSGTKDRGALREMLRKMFHVDEGSDKAAEKINHMIDQGYTLVARNRQGIVVVYTNEKQIRMDPEELAEMAKFVGLHKGDKLQMTAAITPGGKGYETKRAEDVFQTTRSPNKKKEKNDYVGTPDTEDKQQRRTAHKPLSADEFGTLGQFQGGSDLAYTP